MGNTAAVCDKKIISDIIVNDQEILIINKRVKLINDPSPVPGEPLLYIRLHIKCYVFWETGKRLSFSLYSDASMHGGVVITERNEHLILIEKAMSVNAAFRKTYYIQFYT